MKNKYASLTPLQLAILADKATEPPYSGVYEQTVAVGTYLCRGCGLALFRAKHQFVSACGWPSFDGEIAKAILRQPDADGRRTEILCAQCGSHLGHVFYNEQLTPLNLRHCVNASAMELVQDENILQAEEAILAAGCFWGVEHLLTQKEGVLKTEVGYCGGTTLNPTYNEVCSGKTGHVEAVRVVFDPLKISYADLIRYFFEIHDPTQSDGQGADVGPQYLSMIFYFDHQQKTIAEEVTEALQKLGYAVATRLSPVNVFWPAEEYHQHYYRKTGKEPYCHFYHEKF